MVRSTFLKQFSSSTSCMAQLCKNAMTAHCFVLELCLLARLERELLPASADVTLASFFQPGAALASATEKSYEYVHSQMRVPQVWVPGEYE